MTLSYNERSSLFDSLFGQMMYYSRAQYDIVYGFPTRLGNKYHWVIEVISFDILN